MVLHCTGPKLLSPLPLLWHPRASRLRPHRLAMSQLWGLRLGSTRKTKVIKFPNICILFFSCCFFLSLSLFQRASFFFVLFLFRGVDTSALNISCHVEKLKANTSSYITKFVVCSLNLQLSFVHPITDEPSALKLPKSTLADGHDARMVQGD